MIAEHDRPDADTDGDVSEVPIIDPEGAGGPEEAPSKEKGSRWNAVQHGLMAKELLPEPLASEVKQWTAILTDRFRPATPYEVAQIAIMGRAGAQLERLRNLRVVDMQRAMDRAALCWDTDRCSFTDKIAARLSKDPMRVSRALARTKQGRNGCCRVGWACVGSLTAMARGTKNSAAWPAIWLEFASSCAAPAARSRPRPIPRRWPGWSIARWTASKGSWKAI